MQPNVVTLADFKSAALAGEAEGLLIRKQLVPEVAADEEDLVLQFTISTGSVDRDGDTVNPDGWVLDNYLKNPVILWAHQYDQLPIGRALGVWVENGKLKARAQFAPRDVNPLGYTVYQMYQQGFLRATSVGFIPLKWTWNSERSHMAMDITQQELLEFSAVPVPANPEALLDAKSKGIDTRPVLEWAEKVLDGHAGEKGLWLPRETVEQIRKLLKPDKTTSVPAMEKAVPRDVSRDTAGKDTEWSAPTLRDFTDQSWDELSDAEKRRIAGHFAWSASLPPERFGDLKLPHHRPSDGAVVWRGVAAAMAALLGARGGVDIPDSDRRAVYNHLASHYRQFDEEPPEFRAYSPDEDAAPGLIATVRVDASELLKAVESLEQQVAELTKAGRVLSAANEDRLKRARDLLDEVLAQLNQEEPDQNSVQPPVEKASDADTATDEDYIEIADDEPTDEPVIELETLQETVQETVQSLLSEVLSEVTGQINSD